MRPERLSGITLLNIEKDFEINMRQIVTDFTAKKDDFSKQNLFMIFKLIFNDIFCLFTAFKHQEKTSFIFSVNVS
jgi:hypothetical protein